MRTAIVSVAVLMALPGCVSNPKSYPLAVPSDCVPGDLPAAPTLDVTPAQMRAAPDAAARVRLAYEFWTAVQPWLAPAEAAIAGCRAAATQPGSTGPPP